MRQPEAEAEAARRNLEDEQRDRYVFYALDVSAGLSDDAWEVSRRLRRPDEILAPVEAGAVGAEAPATSVAADVPAPPARSERRPPAGTRARAGLPVRLRALRPPRRRRPAFEVPEPVDNGASLVVEEQPGAELEGVPVPPARDRGASLLRLWAVLVILIGVLFLATTLLVAFSLRDYVRLGVLPVLLGLGIGGLTVWLGAALWRS